MSDAPTDDEFDALLHTVIARLMKMLTRLGVLVEDMGQTWLAEPDAEGKESRTLRPLQAAAPRSRTTRAEHSRMLVVPLVDEDWTQEAKETAKTKRSAAKNAMSDSAMNRLVEIECADTDWHRFKVGDRVIQRLKKRGVALSLSHPLGSS